jgi:hypothetical protein
MKKVFLITVFALLSFNIFAQSKVDINSLIGYWEPNRHSTRIVFWKDIKNRLQVIEFDTVDGVPLRLLSMKIVNSTLVIKTICDEKNWTTECSYTFIDDNTLECIVKGPINTTVVYTRVK